MGLEQGVLLPVRHQSRTSPAVQARGLGNGSGGPGPDRGSDWG